MTGTPPVPPSAEVVAHHEAMHENSETIEHICSCGQTIAHVCAGCGQAVSMTVEPGSWCQHAEAVWRARSVN